MSSAENYLRAIYHLTGNGKDKATTSEVAEYMGVSPASVSEAIKKLEDRNLVCRADYRGFTLSPMGKDQGEQLQEKYDVLEKFFSDFLGLENGEKEADRAEHSISKEAVEEIRKVMAGE